MRNFIKPTIQSLLENIFEKSQLKQIREFAEKEPLLNLKTQKTVFPGSKETGKENVVLPEVEVTTNLPLSHDKLLLNSTGQNEWRRAIGFSPLNTPQTRERIDKGAMVMVVKSKDVTAIGVNRPSTLTYHLPQDASAISIMEVDGESVIGLQVADGTTFLELGDTEIQACKRPITGGDKITNRTSKVHCDSDRWAHFVARTSATIGLQGAQKGSGTIKGISESDRDKLVEENGVGSSTAQSLSIKRTEKGYHAQIVGTGAERDFGQIFVGTDKRADQLALLPNMENISPMNSSSRVLGLVGRERLIQPTLDADFEAGTAFILTSDGFSLKSPQIGELLIDYAKNKTSEQIIQILQDAKMLDLLFAHPDGKRPAKDDGTLWLVLLNDQEKAQSEVNQNLLLDDLLHKAKALSNLFPKAAEQINRRLEEIRALTDEILQWVESRTSDSVSVNDLKDIQKATEQALAAEAEQKELEKELELVNESKVLLQHHTLSNQYYSAAMLDTVVSLRNVIGTGEVTSKILAECIATISSALNGNKNIKITNQKLVKVVFDELLEKRLAITKEEKFFETLTKWIQDPSQENTKALKSQISISLPHLNSLTRIIHSEEDQFKTKEYLYYLEYSKKISTYLEKLSKYQN
ncbi:hypothetical protein IT417_02870 [bacterium]|nr:hypothetical protein [bacterium]